MTATISIMLLFMVTLVFLNVPIAIALGRSRGRPRSGSRRARICCRTSALVMFDGATKLSAARDPVVHPGRRRS